MTAAGESGRPDDPTACTSGVVEGISLPIGLTLRNQPAVPERGSALRRQRTQHGAQWRPTRDRRGGAGGSVTRCSVAGAIGRQRAMAAAMKASPRYASPPMSLAVAGLLGDGRAGAGLSEGCSSR